MVGSVDAWSVEPVVNPRVGPLWRKRLIRMTKAEIEGRSGPRRQVRYRDTVVSPLALELECRKLLHRALREITELLLDLVSSMGGNTAGPMTAAVLLSQNRAISMARDATTARVLSLELLAAHVAVAEAARRDWETAHLLAAQNDRYLDLVARTAADQHATVEIEGLAEHAAEASQALRETLQQATLAAEALALPGPR